MKMDKIYCHPERRAFRPEAEGSRKATQPTTGFFDSPDGSLRMTKRVTGFFGSAYAPLRMTGFRTSVCLLLCLVLVLSCFAGCTPNDGRVTINVYNWGQYISEGEDGCIDVIAEFEKAYPNIRVNYVTFDSNETMYTKMSNGGITVDVIIPSDYMLGRLIDEDMLLPLNFDNIPNFQYVDERFKNPNYDPENLYSVPYTWGMVGIIYNTKYVDEADVTGWELLWNEKYAGKILMFDNSRDAFGIAQCLLGYDINTTNEEELRKCAELLRQQKPVVQQYIMDQVFDLMENGEAWITPYYAGDYLTMADENEDLAFYLPAHQGYNLFVDAMCIPKCSKNKTEAELFINFLCQPEIAGGNMDWICYGTPISAAKEFMDPEVVGSEISYPSEEIMDMGRDYIALPATVSRFMEELWMDIRNR